MLAGFDLIEAELHPTVWLVFRVPVVRVNIPQDNSVAQFMSNVVDELIMGAKRWTEELDSAISISNQSGGFHDFVPDLRLSQLGEIGVSVRMIADVMSLGRNALENVFSMRGREVLTDDEKNGFLTMFGKNIQQFWCVHRVGTVIE